jgi:membrane fusion protein, multidrug efflux system
MPNGALSEDVAPKADVRPAIPVKAVAPTEQAPTGDGSAPAKRAGLKRAMILGVALFMAYQAAGFGWQYWTVGRFVESTDNAYVHADIVGIAPQLSGQIARMAVTDNQPVKAGDVLLTIDDASYRAAMAKAKADVDSAQAMLSNLEARVTQQQAQIAAAKAAIESVKATETQAVADLARTQALVQKGAAPAERMDDASAAADRATAAVTAADANLAAAQEQLNVLASERASHEADIARAKAAEQAAAIDLDHTVLRAPIDGIIGNRGADAGQFVRAGQALMDVVPVDNVFVVANFKETQVAGMRVGMTVEVAVDRLDGRIIEGRIDSFAPASGAEFSVIPTDNATGNFTKIVQRFPVKIALDVPADLRGLILPGASVTADVSTKAADAGESPLATYLDWFFGATI